MSTYCYGLESFFQQFGFLHSTNQKQTSSEGKQNETISKKPPGGATKKKLRWFDPIPEQKEAEFLTCQKSPRTDEQISPDRHM